MATPTKPLRKIAEASHLCRSPRCFWAQMGNPGAGPRQGLEEFLLKMACFQGLCEFTRVNSCKLQGIRPNVSHETLIFHWIFGMHVRLSKIHQGTH